MSDSSHVELIRMLHNVDAAPPLRTEVRTCSAPATGRHASVAGTTKPRILYVIGQLGPGGAERQLVFLLQAMDRERYRPAVAVWNYQDQEPYVAPIRTLGVPMLALATASSSFTKLWLFRRYVQKLRPEVVHSYTFFTNIPAYVGAIGSSAVVIGAIQGDYFQDVKSSGRLRSCVNALWPRDQIFNSFTAVRNADTALRLFRPRRPSVVRNGLDLDQFVAPSDRVSAGTPLLLGVGSLLGLKRWDRLLRAAAELKRLGLDFRVEIAGDGPMRSSLEALARELGIADRVRFLGFVSSVEERMWTASALVHTSDSEGTPNAVIEAMAAGLAVVATDSGDVRHIVDHGRTGYVVRRGDDAGLVNYLAKLLTNAGQCREMGREGRLKAEREFRLDRLVSETLDVYRAAGWRDRARGVRHA